jgi:hypothetical protein
MRSRPAYKQIVALARKLDDQGFPLDDIANLFVLTAAKMIAEERGHTHAIYFLDAAALAIPRHIGGGAGRQ